MSRIEHRMSPALSWSPNWHRRQRKFRLRRWLRKHRALILASLVAAAASASILFYLESSLP